ncbi:hypothetical protein BW054_003913 [Salmonella enterica subsp. enterica serovar Javiana]|uniref:Uncharacterized protein n=25 Tax=Enterobacteriaceae TaxID=543 RepID=A0A0X8LH42_ECOLX|nr:orf; hypothetical protein [Salmonella enterica subsp. enterica serovar Typhi]AEZ48583.1 hypothetical protein STBHUCCB_p1320 [Salmonella enterica subsp. enterica serovar Typhi str. P-stx-12]AKJ20355.1 hypothetical protein [Salmonella enterica subsp. enterica serovar Typhimurium]AMF86701.1 hypothetical protein AL551_00015 [Escherichia coli]ASO45326.1 hypothetical protein CHD02_25620 [Salmonella enterica subsp. enterica serovar Derby]ASZ39838.1 hypothetical protein CK947_25505 [Salmonella ente
MDLAGLFFRVLVVINAGNNDGSGQECSETAVEYWSGDIDEHIAQVINAEEKYADNDDKANRFAVEQFHQELSFWGEMTPALHHIRCQFFFGNGPILTRKKTHQGGNDESIFEVPMACHFLNSGKERCCRTQSKYRKVTFPPTICPAASYSYAGHKSVNWVPRGKVKKTCMSFRMPGDVAHRFGPV